MSLFLEKPASLLTTKVIHLNISIGIPILRINDACNHCWQVSPFRWLCSAPPAPVENGKDVLEI
jgi:hypothetical protein